MQGDDIRTTAGGRFVQTVRTRLFTAIGDHAWPFRHVVEPARLLASAALFFLGSDQKATSVPCRRREKPR